MHLKLLALIIKAAVVAKKAAIVTAKLSAKAAKAALVQGPSLPRNIAIKAGEATLKKLAPKTFIKYSESKALFHKTKYEILKKNYHPSIEENPLIEDSPLIRNIKSANKLRNIINDPKAALRNHIKTKIEDSKLEHSIKFKAQALETFNDSVNDILKSKTNYLDSLGDIVKQINNNELNFKNLSVEQMRKVNEYLDNQLKERMPESYKKLEMIQNADWKNLSEIEEKQIKKYYRDIMKRSHRKYLEDYKEKFFDSDGVIDNDGNVMDDDTKQNIWERIENDMTYKRFKKIKISSNALPKIDI